MSFTNYNVSNNNRYFSLLLIIYKIKLEFLHKSNLMISLDFSLIIDSIIRLFTNVIAIICVIYLYMYIYH